MLIIVGAGGHASDVADLAIRCGIRPAGAVDDNPSVADRLRSREVPFLGSLGDLPTEATYTLGLGYPSPRRVVSERLRSTPHPPLVDPSAVLSPTAKLMEGVQVFWQAAVSPDCRLGRHVLVSYGATVGHDTTIADCSCVMPGARISGNVTIGAGVLVGSGAVVLQGVHIADDAVVGAGAVVTRDVAAGATVMGVPARPR